MNIKLIANVGTLYTGKPSSATFLIRETGHGDVATIDWPNPRLVHLGAALFDARETGQISADTQEVELPDGSVQP